MKLTMAQALVKFLDNQYVCFDGKETKFVNGIFGIFGHGCVVGIGQALEQGGHSLTYYQGHNEQGMAHAAIAFAKQKNRREIIACTSSIGPGALNMDRLRHRNGEPDSASGAPRRHLCLPSARPRAPADRAADRLHRHRKRRFQGGL